VVVRSDDVEGNQVAGGAWPAGRSGQERRFIVQFTDEGEVTGCRIDG
jgi:hypothetical protein